MRKVGGNNSMEIFANGILCYGLLLNKTMKYPWHCEEYGDDNKALAEWWRRNEIDAFDRQRQNSCPVTLALHCSSKDPMYILTTPSSIVKTATRGYPVEISLEKLEALDTTTIDHEIMSFCNEYGIKLKSRDIGWYLCSYSYWY